MVKLFLPYLPMLNSSSFADEKKFLCGMKGMKIGKHKTQQLFAYTRNVPLHDRMKLSKFRFRLRGR